MQRTSGYKWLCLILFEFFMNLQKCLLNFKLFNNILISYLINMCNREQLEQRDISFNAIQCRLTTKEKYDIYFIQAAKSAKNTENTKSHLNNIIYNLYAQFWCIPYRYDVPQPTVVGHKLKTYSRATVYLLGLSPSLSLFFSLSLSDSTLPILFVNFFYNFYSCLLRCISFAVCPAPVSTSAPAPAPSPAPPPCEVLLFCFGFSELN